MFFLAWVQIFLNVDNILRMQVKTGTQNMNLEFISKPLA